MKKNNNKLLVGLLIIGLLIFAGLKLGLFYITDYGGFTEPTALATNGFVVGKFEGSGVSDSLHICNSNLNDLTKNFVANKQWHYNTKTGVYSDYWGLPVSKSYCVVCPKKTMNQKLYNYTCVHKMICAHLQDAYDSQIKLSDCGRVRSDGSPSYDCSGYRSVITYGLVSLRGFDDSAQQVFNNECLINQENTTPESPPVPEPNNPAPSQNFFKNLLSSIWQWITNILSL